ncbi:N-6 DNA methylase, partial [Vibrio parahaemolyticus]
MSEIEENHFNLNIPRYVDTFEEEVRIDLIEVTNSLSLQQDQTDAIDLKLGKITKELG